MNSKERRKERRKILNEIFGNKGISIVLNWLEDPFIADESTILLNGKLYTRIQVLKLLNKLNISIPIHKYIHINREPELTLCSVAHNIRLARNIVYGTCSIEQ